MNLALILIIPLFFTGCIYFNDRGISNEYYNECHEYYDSMGIYHKNCDKNIIEYKDVSDGVEKVYEGAKKAIKN